MNILIELCGLIFFGWAIYYYLRRQPHLDETAVRVRWYGALFSAALYFAVLEILKSVPKSWKDQNTPALVILFGIPSLFFFCFLLLPNFSRRVARLWSK
jgi:hypothetical protein